MTYAVNLPRKIGDEMSTAEDSYSSLWGHRSPPHKLRPADRLFEFTRASDRRWMVVAVQFHGESYGWEARILEADGGWLSHSRGRFQTSALTVQWSEQERISLERR